MATHYEAEDMQQKNRTLTAQVLALVLFVAAVFLLLGRPTGMAEWRGFLSVRSTLFTDIGLLIEMGAVTGMWVGSRWARDGRIYSHQYMLTACIVLYSLVVLLIAVPRYGLSGGLMELLHLAFALPAVGMGIYLLLRMYRLIPRSWRVSGWRGLMRMTILVYTAAALLGAASYLLALVLS